MMRSKRNDYFRINGNVLQPPIFGIPIENVFNYATTYAKASWVYHMLRTMLGDDVFYPVLRTYFNRYAYGNANTEEFKNIFKQEAPNPPIDYDVFFDQWLMKRGHPIVKFSTLREHVNAQNETYIHFVINQDLVFTRLACGSSWKLSNSRLSMAFRFRRMRVASSRTLRGSLQARAPRPEGVDILKDSIRLRSDESHRF